MDRNGIIEDKSMTSAGIASDLGGIERKTIISAEMKARCSCLSNAARRALRAKVRSDAHELKVTAANLLAGKFNKFLSLNQQAEVKLLGFLDALEGDLSDIENCTIDHFAKLGADECKARV